MATVAHAPDLVERDRELASLHALLAGAVAGRGRVALIEGPAGIGKSRLLAELREAAARDGIPVLAARASELEREFPFGVVRQLLEAPLAAPGAAERLLAGAAAPAGPIFAAVGDEGAGTGGDGGFAALHGLFWLTLNLAAERPLVLAVDDLHWCDAPSLRFIAYLVRRLEGLPVLVAVTVRASDPGTDPALLSELAHDPAAETVRPAPLSPAGTGDLVRAGLAGAEDAFCAVCHVATQGNPLLLRQLVRALEAEGVRPDAAHAGVVREIGPSAVGRTVLLRLARLPPTALAVARAVAVLGEAAEVAAVAELAGLDQDAIGEATQALARAEILRAGLPLGFVHPLVQDTIARELPPGAREGWHARAADVLRARGAAPDRVAAQLLSVPPRGEPWVAELLVLAAEDAARRGAPDIAATHLARALAEPPRAELRPGIVLRLGLAEARSSGMRAAEHLQEAYDTLADPADRGLAADVLARTLQFTSRREEALAVVRRATAELPPGHEDRRRALLAIGASALQWGAGSLAELRTLLAADGPLEPGSGPGARGLRVFHALRRLYDVEPAGAVAAMVLEALADGSLVAADDGLFAVTALLVLVCCEREEALDLRQAALAQAHRVGSPFGVLAVRLWGGFADLRRGELVDAEAALREAAAEMERWSGNSGGSVFCAAILASALIGRGDLAGARAALERTGEDVGRSDEGARWHRRALQDLLLAEGRPDEALAAGEAPLAHAGWTDNPACATSRAPRALALDRLGRREEALALAGEDVALARRFGARGAIGRALLVRGTVRREDGGEDLEAAVRALAASPARLDHARALAALGGLVRRSRRPVDAREPLRQALELADACGADALAGRVRTELHAAGARPRTAALSGAGSLTASERRVAELAAGGATNREIAQELFVTPKTVEVHLSNGYRKLGIASRRELPGVLAPQT